MGLGRPLLQTAVLDGTVGNVRMSTDGFKDSLDMRPTAGSSVSLFRFHREADRSRPAPGGATGPVGPLMPHRANPARIWDGLPATTLDPATVAAHHLIVSHADDPVGKLFDILRTRMMQALEDYGWNRIGICAPTAGCGASYVAANLALSLARRPSCRTVLVDLDLAAPRQATLFGAPQAAPLRDMLSGDQPIESHLVRLGPNLALALNGRPETGASELLQEPSTIDTLDLLRQDLAPDVVVFDLPPVLDSDATIGFLPQLDGVLLVADGTRTHADQIRDCERLFSGRTQFLGVVLNRAEDSPDPRKRRRG